jgi:hypothetical protein
MRVKKDLAQKRNQIALDTFFNAIKNRTPVSYDDVNKAVMLATGCNQKIAPTKLKLLKQEAKNMLESKPDVAPPVAPVEHTEECTDGVCDLAAHISD